MVLNCVAYNCNNVHDTNKGISFHSFPFKRPEILKLWIKAISRDDWNPSKTSRLCGEHFLPSNYQDIPGSKRKVLKLDAIPSVFNFSKHLKTGTKPRKEPTRHVIKRQATERSDQLDAELAIAGTSTVSTLPEQPVLYVGPKKLEEDMENYLKFKLMGGQKIIKHNIVPHIFNCQPNRNRAHTQPSRTVNVKELKQKMINHAQVSTATSFEGDMQSSKTIDLSASGVQDVQPANEMNDSAESLASPVLNTVKVPKQTVNQKIVLVQKIENDLSVCSEDAQKSNTNTRQTIDEFDALGISWAAKVRRLDEDQKVLAEDLINQVLRRGYFKELTRTTEIHDSFKEDSSNIISFLENESLHIKSESDDT